MMAMIQSIFSGLIQGISEIFPISSSAHLLLLGKFINTNKNFMVSLHFGSMLAIVFYLRSFLIKSACEAVKEIYHYERFVYTNFVIKTVVATLPVVIVGFVVVKLQFQLNNHVFMMFNMFFLGLVMVFVSLKKSKNNINILNISYKQAFIIGMAQTLSIMPGMSRLGVCAISAIFLGIPIDVSIYFSFILAIPSLLGAFVLFAFNNKIIIFEYNVLLGVFSSFFFSFITMYLFMKIIKKSGLFWFGIYRIFVSFVGVYLL